MIQESTKPARCSTCRSNMEFPVVCTGCNELHTPPASVDYFTLLGLPRRFDLDEAKLRETLRHVARYIHPDRFADAPDEVRRLATRLSADTNNAFAVLSDPVRRADYLLDLAGGPSAATLRDVPKDLLPEVMTLREQIADARACGDESALDRVRDLLVTRRSDTIGRIAALAGQLATADDTVRRELRVLINSTKYFENLLADLTTDPFAPDAEEVRGDG